MRSGVSPNGLSRNVFHADRCLARRCFGLTSEWLRLARHSVGFAREEC